MHNSLSADYMTAGSLADFFACYMQPIEKLPRSVQAMMHNVTNLTLSRLNESHRRDGDRGRDHRRHDG